MPALGEYLINDKRYYSVARACEIIGPGVRPETLSVWCRRGFTPWDLELDTIRHPIVIHAKGRPTARHYDHRVLISQECTQLLQRLLSELDRPIRPSRFTNNELEALRTATAHLRCP